MKGSAQFILGLFAIVLIAVIFFTGVNLNYSRHLNIASSSAKIYEAEDAAESVKRSLDSAAYFSLQVALREEFENSGPWGYQIPSEEDFFSAVKEKFSERFSQFRPESTGAFSLQWKPLEAKLIKMDDYVKISGSRGFEIKKSGNPEISMKIPGDFNRKFFTGAVGLFHAGRLLLDGENWNVDKNVIDSEGAVCAEKVSDASLEEGSYKKIEQNIIAAVVVCGFSGKAGALSEPAFDSSLVQRKISSALTELGTAEKAKTGFDYSFSAEVSGKSEGSAEKVSVRVSVSISDGDSLVPAGTGFSPLALKFSVPVEFGMPAAQVGQ